jgi:CBS domain-containing protein
MRIADAMTRDVQMVTPDQNIAEAARLMADCDFGVVPVAENDRLVGMLTDRDIVVRGLATGKTADAKIRDVMTADVKYCFEDEDLDEVTQNMGDLQVRRLPVLSRDKRLVGIVSLGDIAVIDEEPAGDALSDISEPTSSKPGMEQRPH